MLNSIRNLKLIFRAVIYMLVMVLFALVVSCSFPSFDEEFLAPWFVCFGAGLASMVIVEPFRHQKGSPYGFLLGGAARTLPPLALLIVVLVKGRAMIGGPTLDYRFWVSLLFSYFLMLITVVTLTIPPKVTHEPAEASQNHKNSEEKTK